VTSGTGRFANTSGGGSYHGSAAGPSGELFMDGSLSGIGRGRWLRRCTRSAWTGRQRHSRCRACQRLRC